MSRWIRRLVLTLLLVSIVAPIRGETELVLIDGRVLKGIDFRRDEGAYVLIQEGGGEIAIPAELVERVRLVGEPLTGRPVPEGPSGIRTGESRTLAGRDVDPPSRSEQLEVFGEPARFQKSIIDSDWKPKSDWDMDPLKNNNFAPSTWSKGVIDPNWQPTSAFDKNKDVLADSRSTWSKGVIDSSWEPTDGFATSVGRR